MGLSFQLIYPDFAFPRTAGQLRMRQNANAHHALLECVKVDVLNSLLANLVQEAARRQWQLKLSSLRLHLLCFEPCSEDSKQLLRT